MIEYIVFCGHGLDLCSADICVEEEIGGYEDNKDADGDGEPLLYEG